jgi:lipopolysaccharide export system protein LptA
MGRRGRFLIAALLLLFSSPLLRGQGSPSDSLFRLVQAERAEQYERFGMHYRLVKGHARFLHNDTYLLCDSASWNVDSRFIEAYGNVQIIQNNTMLKSEQMFYWIDENKAQFRGPLVELFDKDGNTLRTDKLIYNTKDSVAVFDSGGSLKSKDGNVIESRRGTYDGKESMFFFEEQVELYMDSIEVKTLWMRYFSEQEKAFFGRNTHLWRDNGFLRADDGWYDRQQKVIYFTDKVFMFDPSYEAWAGEVYYYQNDGAADLYKDAQVLDTTNKSIYMGDHLQYVPATDSTSDRGLLTDNPAIVYYGENENHEVDTLYTRADTFYVYALPRCSIPEEEISESKKRLEDIMYDALAKKREEEAVQREQERIKKMRDAGKLPPEWVEKQKQAEADSLAALARLDSLVTVGLLDSLAAAPDSIRSSRQAVDSLISVALMPPDDSSAVAAADSLSAPVDSLAAPPADSTLIRYVKAWNKVRMYRSDLQAACDSMVFTELDSIARLYGSPVLWNEVHNQLSADEMQLLMKDGSLDRGSMITNAWLISERDSVHYNQIKSTEMLGYFRDNKIYRFDALGGVSAIFYMVEDSVITTINVKESKSLTAALKDGTAQRMLYVESIKSDAYPVGELPVEKQRLKDFKWRGDERPVSRRSITQRRIRESERSKYETMRKPSYRETNKYFDNYMYKLFEKLDAEKRAEQMRKQAEADSLAALEAVSAALADSLSQMNARLIAEGIEPNQEIIDQIRDSMIRFAIDSIAAKRLEVPMREQPDTVAVQEEPARDTIAVRDSSAFVPETPVMPEKAAVSVTERPERIERIEKKEEEVAAASPETVIHTEQLSRAEKRALRRAERKARREARRAARLARRLARKNHSL